MMLHNKENVICHALIMAVTIVLLGFSSSYYYCSASALPFQSANNHHKVFDKKQDNSDASSKDASNDGDGSDNGDGPSSKSDKTLSHTDDSSSDTGRVSSSSNSDSRGSKSSNNLGNSDYNDNNNNKNNDQGTNDGGNTGEKQGTGENVQVTRTNTPQTTCEQASNCTDQQGSSDIDRNMPRELGQLLLFLTV
jgi:hypothetical protein